MGWLRLLHTSALVVRCFHLPQGHDLIRTSSGRLSDPQDSLKVASTLELRWVENALRPEQECTAQAARPVPFRAASTTLRTVAPRNGR
jgi:hypothetical protein